MKRSRFIIYDPILKADIYVQLEGEAQDAINWFAKEASLPEYIVETKSFGKFFENSSHHGGCIWVENKSDIFSLIHEVLHCVHYVMRRLRIELREDNEEIFCYYFEWLLKEISLKGKLKLGGKKWEINVVKTISSVLKKQK